MKKSQKKNNKVEQKKSNVTLYVIGAVGLIVVLFVYFSFSQNKASAKSLSYSKDIEPIMASKCVSCHSINGSASRKPLDNYKNTSLFVNAGDSKNSRIVQAVDGGSMSGRLTTEEVDIIKRWIDQGAKE